MQVSLIGRYATRAELHAFLDGVMRHDEDSRDLWFRHELGVGLPYAVYEETFYVDPSGVDGVLELPDGELHANPAELG